jgi:hypothetical protein
LREELHFTSCLADPDVWLQLARQKDGKEYYEYLLVYVDDLLAVSEQPKAILDDINTSFHLKPESVQWVPSSNLLPLRLPLKCFAD